VHEADEPNAASQHGGDVDPLAMQAEATAGGDESLAIVERILLGVRRWDDRATGKGGRHRQPVTAKSRQVRQGGKTEALNFVCNSVPASTRSPPKIISWGLIPLGMVSAGCSSLSDRPAKPTV
jgi:hypothetical protein